MPRDKKNEKKKISLNCYGSSGKTERLHGNSRSGALSHALPKGSLTVETALALPVFVFAAAFVLFLFVMMQVQYIVGNCLDRAVAEVSLMRDVSAREAGNLAKAAFYQELSAQGCPLSQVELGIAGFSWESMEVDGSYIDAQVAYRVKFPFRFFGKKALRFSNGRRMRRWTGESGAAGKEAAGDWVYVTPEGSVYHGSRDCTHLKLSITSVSAARLKADLKRYGPCEICTKGQRMGPTVYVTNEGDRYHYRINCSGLKRTVYMIARERVGARRPCSRCGG